MSNATVQQARRRLDKVRREYSPLARQLGWDSQQEWIKTMNYDDLDELTNATAEYTRMVTEAKAALAEQPDQNVAVADEDALEVAPEVVSEGSKTSNPAQTPSVRASAETIRMTAEETEQYATMPPELPTIGPRARILILTPVTPDTAKRFGWIAVAVTAFLLSFLATSGYGETAVMLGLFLLLFFGGKRALQHVIATVREMPTLQRLARIGVIAVIGSVLLGAVGLATASPWMMAVTLVVFSLVVDRVLRRRVNAN